VFALHQNYPNPFNPTTTISYGLPQKFHVSLKVYNTLGQLVATLVNDEQEAGYREVKFDGSDLASGVYFYQLQAGSYVNTKKLLLLR
jgi:flagellar hook assembly protein FlgD